MLPLESERAEAFWKAMHRQLPAANAYCSSPRRRHRRVVGTVQVILAAPENQPHRGEIAKMLVHRSARRRGIADALMRAAEEAALARARHCSCSTPQRDAARLYDRMGWPRVGVIPGYALWPAGGLVDTTVFYKLLGWSFDKHDR